MLYYFVHKAMEEDEIKRHEMILKNNIPSQVKCKYVQDKKKT